MKPNHTSAPASTLRSQIADLHTQIATLASERDAARREVAALKAQRSAAPPAAAPQTSPSPKQTQAGGLAQMRAELERLKANPAVNSQGEPDTGAVKELEARIRQAEKGGAYAKTLIPKTASTATPIQKARADLERLEALDAKHPTPGQNHALDAARQRVRWLEASADGGATDPMGLTRGMN